MSACRIVYEIFSVKEWRDLETGSMGASRWLKMAPFDRSHTTFYWSAIVNIDLSGTVFELLDVEWYRDLELWVRGHSRSPFESLGAVSAFHSNYGSLLHHLRDKAKYWSKIVIFLYPLAFGTPVRPEVGFSRIYYPPFARESEGRSISFTLCFFVCSLFCQLFLDNRANSSQILHTGLAGVLWFRMCLRVSPLLGVSGPRRAEKGGNEIFVTIGVNEEFLHFGGFWAISQQRVDRSKTKFHMCREMSGDVPLPNLGSIGPWGRVEGS